MVILSTNNFLLPKHEIHQKGQDHWNLLNWTNLVVYAFILQCCEDELVALVLPSHLLACNYLANSKRLQLCLKGILFFENETNYVDIYILNSGKLQYPLKIHVDFRSNRPNLSPVLSVFECYWRSEQLSLFKRPAVFPFDF